MTVSDVQGFGREKGMHRLGAPHRAFEDVVEYVKKERIEIVALDEMVDLIFETIARTAHTGNPGDGKVFVWPVERALRIQTREFDDGAIQ